MFMFTFSFYHLDKSLWPSIRSESCPEESMAWATCWHGPKAHHNLLYKWAELTHVAYTSRGSHQLRQLWCLSRNGLEVTGCKAHRIMGHLCLDHPTTEWLHHAVVEVSSIHWWGCAELSQGIYRALPCCLSQVLRVLCKACFRCLTSQIQHNMPAL